MAYVASQHTTVSKPIGISGNATDARSRYYDATVFKYRDYVSTAEVLTYLATSANRTGGFSIFVNTGGTLSNGVITGGTRAEWWFKDGTADGDLVEKGSGGGDVTIINNLNETTPGSALDATQGKILNDNKANLASPTFTGTPAAPTAAVDTNTTQLATTAYVIAQGYAKINSPTFTGTVGGITKGMVGLGNVNDTSDATKNSATAIITNKTISGADNTLSNIPQGAVDDLVSDLGNKADKLTTVGAAITGDYTLQASDNATHRVVDKATQVNITIDSTLPVGFSMSLRQKGAGVIHFIAGAGVTINSYSDFVDSVGVNAIVTVFVESTGVVALGGGLA